MIGGRAKPTNADWRKAYDNVVKLVNPANGYSEPKQWIKNKEEGETESDQYKIILADIAWQLRLQRTKGGIYGRMKP